ncbi:MAG: HAMP domain-containing sensor histidine kinase [Bacillota bacterium]|nr:HAMP domain-containing sensor histidine kinase [Bacillota bacterium]
MKKLKNWPLALQIWTVFTLVIVVIFVLLSLYFSMTIRSFFTDEIYRAIETAQKNNLQKASGKAAPNEETSVGEVNNDIREVKHVRLSYVNDEADLTKIQKIIPDKSTAELFLKKLKSQAKNQTNITARYIERTGSGRILYVVRVNGNKKGNFMVSYMWDTYRNSLVSSLVKRIFTVMIIALIISLIAAKYLAQRLVTPLRELRNKVQKIGKKQWHEEINVARADEIGELSASIEEMRKELINQDEYEQTMLQQASHDLKTPLMVIRSYVKAVEDGIYPKGDLESTMKVIDSEAERMQKRIKNLLYLTKINYMAKHQDELSETHIKDLVVRVVDSFMYNEKNIKFQLDLWNIKIRGEEEQWAVVLENIIDNGLRYAKSIIKIKTYEDAEAYYISIYNDGEEIPNDKLEQIFRTFKKDKGGNFGLGLDIGKRIVNMYGGDIRAQNEDIGVSFIVTLKKS